MTNDAYTAKKYLSQAYRAEVVINSLKNLQVHMRLRSNGLKSGMKQELQNTQHTPPFENSMQNIINNVVDLEQRIKLEESKLYALKTEILTAINRVPELNYRALLIERYVKNEKWEKLALSLNYSRSQVFEIHKKALEAFAKNNGNILANFKRPD